MLVNAYCTRCVLPPLAFPHVLRSRRDRSDPELSNHLNGFAGFVMDRGKRPMTQMRYQVLRHIERVRHQLALEVDDGQISAFAAWARAANAIVFLQDGTVREPDGAVLVDPKTGDPQPGADVPYPADAVERKSRSDSALAQLGVRAPKTLPPVVGEEEAELRTPSEVALRCLALFACAVRAESLASGTEIAVADLRQRMPLAFTALSPKEQAFLDASTPAQQDIVNHAWRYEALWVLAWAAGALPALPPASRTCDVPALAKAMLASSGQAFVQGARLRPPAEILDELDMHFRLHWATTEARVQKTPPPAGLEPGVVHERHYALNWMTRFGEADWDDVDTPT
jgi:hypothetical protein